VSFNAYEEELWWCPSVDVCAWCVDPECDGISCIAGLDVDALVDRDAIEQLHDWLRRGRLAEQADRIRARAENRTWP
jgi:hypothetical protein